MPAKCLVTPAAAIIIGPVPGRASARAVSDSGGYVHSRAAGDPNASYSRSIMRPKVFHGTNSITCANSVVPRFMRHPKSFRPVSIANTPGAIQIVEPHATLEPRITIDVAVDHSQMHRTRLSRQVLKSCSTLARRQ